MGCPKACDTPQDTYATSARRRAPIRGLLSLVTESSVTSWTRPPRREADPAAGRELPGDARDTRPTEQRFLNRSPCTDAVADSEPPPEPRARARADATPSPRRVAAISTRARAQQRFGGVRALPQKDVQFGARRARGLPQHRVLTLPRRHKTCVGPAVGRRRRRPDPGICARRAVPLPPTRTARTSRTV